MKIINNYYKKYLKINFSNLVIKSILLLILIFSVINLFLVFSIYSKNFILFLLDFFSSFSNWYLVNIFYFVIKILFEFFKEIKLNNINTFLKLFNLIFSLFIFISFFLNGNYHLFSENNWKEIYFNISKFILIPTLFFIYFFLDIKNIILTKINGVNYAFSIFWVFLMPILFLFFNLIYSLLFKKNLDNQFNFYLNKNIFFLFLNIFYFPLAYILLSMFLFWKKIYFNKIEQEKLLLGFNLILLSAILMISFLIITSFLFFLYIHIKKISFDAFSIYRIILILFSFLIIQNLIVVYGIKKQIKMQKINIFFIIHSTLFSNILGIIGSIILLQNKKEKINYAIVS